MNCDYEFGIYLIAREPEGNEMDSFILVGSTSFQGQFFGGLAFLMNSRLV